jgi:hypothetical protein
VSRQEKRAICRHFRKAADAEPTQRDNRRLDRLLEVPVSCPAVRMLGFAATSVVSPTPSRRVQPRRPPAATRGVDASRHPRGRTALQSVRELVGDFRPENHNLRVDRIQGCRSVWSRARRCRPGEARPARTARIAPPTRGGGAHAALLSALRAPLHRASTEVDLRRVARLRPSFASPRIRSAVRTPLCPRVD